VALARFVLQLSKTHSWFENEQEVQQIVIQDSNINQEEEIYDEE
jgi:hypothetical protein